MRFKSLWGSGFGQLPAGRPRLWRFVQRVLPGSIVVVLLTPAAFAQQNQTSPNPEKPSLLPEANRLPDVNDQMEMREQRIQRQNFDAANVERHKQLMQAAEMLETMAIALKAELDNTSANKVTENTLHKADTIERLARIVKERMTLTEAPN